MRLFQEHSNILEDMTMRSHLTTIRHFKHAVGVMFENARKTGKIIFLS